MSKAPCVMREYSSAVCSSPKSSGVITTGCLVASRLTIETSLVGLKVLIESSMWRISAMTASMSCSPLAGSSAHSSTKMRVPMMPSTRRDTQAACAGCAASSAGNSASRPIHRRARKVAGEPVREGPAPRSNWGFFIMGPEANGPATHGPVSRSRSGRETRRLEQALLGKPLAIEQPREILRAAVAQHRHDGMPGSHLAGNAHRGGHIDAAGTADEQPLFPQQPVHVVHGFTILDVHGIIDRCALHIGRDAADADALGDRAAAGGLDDTVADVLVERAAGRIGEHRAHLGTARLEELGHARHGATGTAGGNEGIDLTFGLLPDLRTRGLHMRAAIGGVVELIGPDRSGQLVGQATCDLLIMVGIAVGHGLHAAHFGTEGLDETVLLG